MTGGTNRWRRAWLVARLGTLALSIGVASGGAFPRQVLAADGKPASVPEQAKVITEGELERSHGVRITHVAVTGGGGLVELRFTVLDPAKASPMLRDGAQPPRLVVEGSGAELEAPHHGAMRNVRVQKDASSFLLFPNVKGAVRPGTKVAVAFGSVKVEPVVAQ